MNFKNHINKIFIIVIVIITIQFGFNILLNLVISDRLSALTSITYVIEDTTNLKVLYESYVESSNIRKENQWDLQVDKIVDKVKYDQYIDDSIIAELESADKLFHQLIEKEKISSDNVKDDPIEIHLTNQIRIRLQTVLSTLLHRSKTINIQIQNINKIMILGILTFSSLVLIVLFRYFSDVKNKISSIFIDLISKSNEIINGEYTKQLNLREIDYEEVTHLKKSINTMSLTVDELIEGLKKSNEEAIHANNVKTEFIANISHEIRTPLSGISGLVQLLQIDEVDDVKKESLNLISYSTNNLSSLVEDLLSISKIEAGKLDVNLEKVDFRELINNISKVFEYKCENNNLTYKLELDEELTRYLMIDEGFIWQILNNVLGNAIKFTEKGGIVFSIKVKNKLPNDLLEVEFRVSDTGIGIPVEKQAGIFEPFVQGEYYLTKRYEGAGLGLSITKRLVELLNGNIKITSSIGSGTTIIIDMPCKISK